MSFEMLQNFDLLSVGISIAGILIFGIVVFMSNPHSITNKTFFIFSLAVSLWGVSNYLSYQFNSPTIVLWTFRFVIFFAVWYAFFIFQLFYVFPEEKVKFPVWYKFFLIPIVLITAIVNLSPLVFPAMAELPTSGKVAKTAVSHGIYLFAIVSTMLDGGAIFLLIKKFIRSVSAERSRLSFIFFGSVITLSLHIVFNLILPGIFLNISYIPLGALFTFPLVAFTAYAIVKHQLFDIKVIATELLTFVIWIAVLIELLLAGSWTERVLEMGLFVFVVVFGIFLIRSVRQEVQRREQFELLTKELSAANEKLKELDDLKTDFISIASHQLRTPLTAIKGYSSMIMEGTYGESPIKIKSAVDKIFQSAQRLIYIVNDLLDISRIEQGRFQLTFEEVKVANVLNDVVEELKPNAQKNNLDLSFNVAIEDAEIKIKADLGKIRQVFLNIIDNAIKYTPSGFVKAELKKSDGNVLISVSDSGVGISETTIKNLFQKFTRAKGIAKLHTDGSGLGLYVAKEIVTAHSGRVWAESDGEGQGSRFFVELPIG